MDKEIFVQNVKKFCALRGVKPTVACIESGAGRNLMTEIRQGKRTSLHRIDLLAEYLGVSAAQLLGEPTPGQTQKGPDSMSAAEAALDAELIARLCQLSPGDLQKVDAFVQGILAAR